MLAAWEIFIYVFGMDGRVGGVGGWCEWLVRAFFAVAVSHTRGIGCVCWCGWCRIIETDGFVDELSSWISAGGRGLAVMARRRLNSLAGIENVRFWMNWEPEPGLGGGSSN